jgi:hypothetical protein
MTYMTTQGTGPVPPTAIGYRQIKGLRRVWRRAHRVIAAGAREMGASLPAVSPAVARELSAIRTFARHMVKHPDMPAAHRARYLAEICRSCEEALEELT